MNEFMLWTERYRPQKFNEVVGQTHIVEKISSFVSSMQIPHLMFAGPAGCGKSTIALIIAKELYGKNWRYDFMEMNASDERGIAIVRSKIKDFARIKPIGKVPFKIIFLDEADALTPEAQNALRRTMENYSNTCRFFLSCNFSSKIIEPIQSRCAVFRFKGISKDDVKARLAKICDDEKVKATPQALGAIADLSEGDIRKAINILQAAAATKTEIHEGDVYEIAASARPEEITRMMNMALEGKFMDARKMLQDLLINRGISGEDILKFMSSQIYDLDLPEKSKVMLVEKIGEYEFRLDQGGDGQIQIEALLAQFTLHKK